MGRFVAIASTLIVVSCTETATEPVSQDPDLPISTPGNLNANGLPPCEAGSALPPAPGLVAHYPFNGDAMDESGNGNHGAVEGAQLTPDRFGCPASAWAFDGPEDIIIVTPGNFNFGTGDWSVSAWTNLNARNAPQRIFMDRRSCNQGQGGFGLETDPSGTVGADACRAGAGTAAESTSDVYGRWVHMVGTRTNGVLAIYIDGVLEATISNGLNVDNNTPAELGNSLEPVVFRQHWVDGVIDDIAVYNRALSPAEVLELCQVGDWDCDGAEAPSPTEQIQAVVDDLEEIVSADPGSAQADKIEDVIAKLIDAIDELTKDPPDNQAAIGSIEGAVGDLEAAVSAQLLDPSVGAALMDSLAGVARQIAVEAFDQATACDPSHPDLTTSQDLLDEGDALRASGAFKDAVSSYKDALSKAESVLSSC